MKSEHRHELQTNELAKWLADFPKWAKENIRVIIYVSVVAVAVLASYMWVRYQKNVVVVREKRSLTELITQIPQNKAQILSAQVQNIDASFVLLTNADKLQAIARRTKNDCRAVVALIKRAELLRTELHYRLTTAPQREAIDQIDRAKDAYTQAIEKALSVPPLVAKAKFGLALCEEELGNFEQAENIYRQISTSIDFQGTIAAEQAKQRLKIIDDFKRKVVFRAAPKQPEKPFQSTMPQIKLDPLEGSEVQDRTFALPEINLPTQ